RELVYPVADSPAALVFLASQNSLAFHTCHVRRGGLDRPDLVVLDLDPSDDDFGKVRHGARLLRDLLPALGLVPFLKTTGSRGLHIVAPIVPSSTATRSASSPARSRSTSSPPTPRASPWTSTRRSAVTGS